MEQDRLPAVMQMEILNSVPGAVYAFRLDQNERLPVYANQKGLEMLEVSSMEEAVSACSGSFWNFVDPRDVMRVRSAYLRLGRNIGSTESFDFSLVTAKGNRRLIHTIARSHKGADGHVWIVDFTMDLFAVTKRNANIPELDPMTNLLEMHAFFAVLASQRKEHRGTAFAVLFVNLINFRSMNIRYGIAYGDRFLQAAGRCIRECFPEGAAAHFGGDHFAVFTPSRQIQKQAMNLREMIKKTGTDTIDCSIGACIWEDPDLTPETVCSRAKIACDDNRKHMNTFFSFYTEAMGKDLEMSEYVTSFLDEAIRRDWIQVYYQPVIRAVSGQLCGVEALARWQDPRRGLLFPASFIEPLEKAQLIWKLDLCVIRQVMEKIAERNAGNCPEIPVSLNLSRVDFLCCDIFYEIETLVKQYDIPRRMLHIEVTESTLTSREDEISHSLDRFRSAGYEIWIDDFGSGYSTLNLLKDYAFDVLKMDMAFLRKDTPRSRSIIASVIAMDKKIGSRTLAEGVETGEQADFLKKCGCEKLQGYYYGKPLPFDELLAHCRERGISVEDARQRTYYETVGQVNFLTDEPVVIAEEQKGRVRLLSANEAARNMLHKDGFEEEEQIQSALDSQGPDLEGRFREAARYAVSTNREGELLLTVREKMRFLRFRLLAVLDDRGLFRVRINDYPDSQKKLFQKNKLLLNILKLYQYVFCIDPGAESIRSLHFSDDLDEASGGVPLLREDGSPAGILPNIFPADRERCRAFLDLKTIRERLKQTEDGILREAFRTRTEQGSYRWMSHRLLYAEGTERKMVLYLIRSMDAENAMEEIQRRGDDPYRALIQKSSGAKDALWEDLMLHIPLALFWKDRERRFLGASRFFLDYFGFADESAVLGRNDEEMNWHPNNEVYKKAEEQVIATGEMQALVPGRCIAKGTARSIYATKWPTYRDGRISGLMGFFLDAQVLESVLEKAKDEDRERKGGLNTAAEFLQDLSDYESENREGKRPFGIIMIRIPELSRIAERYGKKAASRVQQVCGKVIAETAGSDATAAVLGIGRYGIIMAAPSRDVLWEEAGRFSAGIEAIHRVDSIPCTLFTKVKAAYGDEAMRFRKTVFSELFEENISGQTSVRRGETQIASLEQFLNEVPLGSYILTPDQTVLYWNKEAERLLGYRFDEVVGKRCVDLAFGCSFVSGDKITGGSCPALVAYRSGQVQTMQMLIRKKDGENLLVRNTLVPIRDDRGSVIDLAALFRSLGDGTYDQNILRDIYEVATRDPLTCLPGRTYMETCIGEELERYQRTGHPFAVLFADMDRFHDVNNRYGHNVGDCLLQELGIRLRKYGRRADRFCRWGGDEFVGLLQLRRPEEIENAAKRFLQLSNRTEIVVDGHQVACQAAIGITVVRQEDDLKSIVSRADRYMFLAKRHDSDQIVTDYSAES